MIYDNNDFHVGGGLMKKEIAKSTPDIAVNAHFDFNLDGWPASSVLITLCLSGVVIYGIKLWLKQN